MLMVLKILRRAKQNNCFQYKNSNVITQPAQDNPGTFPEGLPKVLTSETYRGPLGDFQGTNTKIYDSLIKLYFRSNSPCITYVFLSFTGKANIKML